MPAQNQICVVQLGQLVETSRRVAATRSRLEKVAHLAALIRQMPPSLVGVGVAYLTGELPQGRVGVGYAVLRDLQPAAGAVAGPPLELGEVDAAFSAIKDVRGAGSVERRAGLLRALFGRATATEQDLLMRLVIGEVRQGALEGIVVDAVARAFSVEASAVRRATMLAGALPAVAVALAQAGEGAGAGALAQFQLQLFHPIQPMLADTAVDPDAALERLGPAAFEYKLDGARVQVHKDGNTVEVYSRQLNRVTAAVPEVVARVAAMPARRLVLDGEAIALAPDGRPLPFQITMRRFGRKADAAHLRAQLPLAVSFFDVLRVDDDTLIDRPLDERWQALAAAVADAAQSLVPRIVTASGEEADAFFARAMADGHEGVMAKGLRSLYSAGRRGQDWLKLKSAHTLDLVVLAAEWGSGRRQGWLSNLHLGARDPDSGGFVMLGKTFKGMTDQTLHWQTEALLARELGREGVAVHVRPELVVEIAFNDVQHSTTYPGGVALRFARLKRYRDDKRAADANTIADVRALLPRG
ncbi:MAG: ligase 1 [Myxococcales bacterium]|jgi:DNA ligase-1|nr:ligase 1 [Myxococcales bacterium]